MACGPYKVCNTRSKCLLSIINIAKNQCETPCIKIKKVPKTCFPGYRMLEVKINIVFFCNIGI